MSHSRPGDPRQVLSRLVGPAGPELTCEQCFDQLDRHVELEVELGGSDADTAIPGMRAHLEGCPACAEDRDSLRELLLSEGPGGD
jgi:hypothetical protein